MKYTNKIINAEMRIPFPAEQIFPLLCPVREYDWIDHWDCEIIHSESGKAELGCVFQTKLSRGCEGTSTDAWIVAEYSPSRRIVFTRTNGVRTCLYSIDLFENEEVTSLKWRQELTGLCEEGNELVEATTQEDFELMVNKLEEMLIHYLKTGLCLGRDS